MIWFWLPACPVDSDEAEYSAEELSEESASGQNKKSLLTREFHPDDWLRKRFPKVRQVLVWIVLPLGYVTVSSMAENGDPQAIPAALLRYAVVFPAALQIFWIPVQQIAPVLRALAP